MRNRSSVIGIMVFGGGILISFLIAYLYAEGAFVRWKSLGSPSTGSSEVISVNFDRNSIASIYVYFDSTQELFRGSLSLCESVDCWERVDSAPDEEHTLKEMTFSNQCSDFYILMRSLSGEVTKCASYSDQMFGTHFVRDAFFVLTDQGTYWTWQFIPGSGASMIMFLGAAISLIVGVLTSYFLRSSANVS